MDYVFIKDSWEQSLNEGKMDDAIERLQYQIATNLMNIHNFFSDVKLKTPSDVFMTVTYANVREENKAKFSIFCDLQFHFCEVSNFFEECGYTKEQIFSELKELEALLIEKMKEV